MFNSFGRLRYGLCSNNQKQRCLFRISGRCKGVFMRSFSNVSVKMTLSHNNSSSSVKRVLESLLEAVHSQSKQTVTPASIILETLKGIDEVSMADYIEKTGVLNVYSLKNVRDIAKMDRDQLERLLQVAEVSRHKYEDLDINELRSAVTNVMLSVVEKMSIKELYTQMARIKWTTIESSREQMKEALRLWVQYPECQLFALPKVHFKFQTKEMTPKFIRNLHFFLEYEIRMMDINRLREHLAQRYQSTIGPRIMLVNRLIAFQEFLIMRVMSEEEIRMFLQKCHWTSRIGSASPKHMRKICILYLKHPNCSRTMAKVKNDSLTNLPEFEHYIKVGIQEAQRIIKRVYHDNPDVKPNSIENRRVENIIPPHVRVNHEFIQTYTPVVCAIDPEIHYWSYEKSLDYCTKEPDMLFYVALVIASHYKVRRCPTFWQNYWTKMNMAKSLSNDQLQKKRIWLIPFNERDFDHVKTDEIKLYSHAEIDKFTDEQIQSVARLYGQAYEYKGICDKERLKNLQYGFVKYRLQKEDLQSILRNFGWRQSDASSVLIRFVYQLLEDPFCQNHMNLCYHTNVNQMPDIQKTIKDLTIGSLNMEASFSHPLISFEVKIHDIIKAIKFESSEQSDILVEKSNPLKLLSAYLKSFYNLQVDTATCKELVWKSNFVSENSENFEIYSIYDIARMKEQKIEDILKRFAVEIPQDKRMKAITLLRCQDEFISFLSNEIVDGLLFKLNLRKSTSAGGLARNRVRLLRWTRQPQLETYAPYDISPPRSNKSSDWTREEDQTLINAVEKAASILAHFDIDSIREYSKINNPPVIGSIDEEILKELNATRKKFVFIRDQFDVWNFIWTIAVNQMGFTRNPQSCIKRWKLLRNYGFDTERVNMELAFPIRNEPKTYDDKPSLLKPKSVKKVRAAPVKLVNTLSIFEKSSKTTKNSKSTLDQDIWKRISELM